MSRYYVWVVDDNMESVEGEGPYGPFNLTKAKQFARIGAEKSRRHNRLVSRGKNSRVASFDVVRIYQKGTGENLLEEGFKKNPEYPYGVLREMAKEFYQAYQTLPKVGYAEVEKAYLSDLRDHFRMSKDSFDDVMVQLNAEGLLALHRSSLSEVFDERKLRKSEINMSEVLGLPGEALAHFVSFPYEIPED